MDEITGDLPEDAVFTASLTLRSVGNNRAILPEMKFSHHLDGEVEDRLDRDQMPYSYIAMMKIAHQINSVMKEVPVNAADLPDDPDEQARVITEMQNIEDGKIKPN